MGNIVVVGVLMLIFTAITYSLFHSFKTKGTSCTSCTACPLVEKCNKDTIKADMRNYINSQ